MKVFLVYIFALNKYMDFKRLYYLKKNCILIAFDGTDFTAVVHRSPFGNKLYSKKY
jgi:hypothetical protein